MGLQLHAIRSEVVLRLGDQVGAVWNKSGDEGEIDSYLNEGYQQFCIRTGILWKQDAPAGLADVAGTATYNLPTDFYQLERYMWKQRAVDIMTAEDARQVDERYQTAQGEVTAVSLDGDGIGVLRKIPVPNETGQNTLLEYYFRPPLLVNDADEFQIPDYMVKFVRFYALFKAFDKEGEGQDLAAATHYKTRFDLGVARANDRRSRVARRRYGRFGGGPTPEGRPPKPRLPWNYPGYRPR